MTTAIASIPLTYDGDDLQHSDLGLFLQITQGLNETVEVRGKDVTVPALAGQIPRNRKGHELKLVLTGQVMGNGMDQAARRADYRTTVRYLRTLFDPTRDPAELAATLEDGAEATIAARPLNIIWNEVIQSEFSFISVELLSVSPDWTIVDGGS